jgi:hypothetical protein
MSNPEASGRGRTPELDSRAGSDQCVGGYSLIVSDAADDYVKIARYVYDLADPSVPEIAAQRLLRAVRPEGGQTLDRLLDEDSLQPIVLVSALGTGKTTEFRQMARRLRATGRFAAFAEACGVLQPIEMDLDPDERKAFQDLLASPKPGVLFVDGLDELALRQRRLGELLRRLEREIDFDAHRIRLVFSARTGAWGPANTKELARLGARVGSESVKLVAFESLDLIAIKKLAAAWGVSKVDAFASELEEEEIDALIEMRPPDVKLFSRLWVSAGNLKRWTDLLLHFVDASFVEDHPHRSRAQKLPIETGRRGLERVAAAAMLMQVPHVSTPTVAILEGAVSSQRLFVDWPPSELIELFENPLFVHKGRGAEAVQLPQGTLSHFLAARWLAERHRLGLPAENLRAFALTRVPGQERYEVPFARRKVVGWLASEVPELRKLIVSDHPAIVLYEGDPDRLADAEIREALGFLCQALDRGEATGSATRATFKRVARPELEAEVRALLEQYRAVPAVLERVLPLVEHGRYRSCSALALTFASCSPRSLVRLFAVEAFAAAAPEERSALIPLTATEEDDFVRFALLRALVPDLLDGQALVSFLRRGGDWVRIGLSEVADKIGTPDLDAVLAEFVPVLMRSTVDGSTKAACEFVVPVVVARLRKRVASDTRLEEALCAVERLQRHHDVSLSDRERKAFTRLLEEDQRVRRAVWIQRFQNASAASDDPFEHLDPLFGDVRLEDMEWLWGLVTGHVLGTFNYPRHVLDRTWSRLAPADRERVFGEAPPELRTYLDLLSESERQHAAKRKEFDDAQGRKLEQRRRENEQALAPRRADIECGDDLNALAWAWQHLDPDSHTGGGSVDDPRPPNLESLSRYVGNEYLDVFLRGLRACWRKIDAPVPTPGEPKKAGDLIGLTGLSLAVRAGLDLSTLSPDEAGRAARLGLYAVNAFPFWYGDLARLHREQVGTALNERLALEWTRSTDVYGVLAFAARSDREVSELMRSLVLDMLEARPPANARTTNDAVDAILTSMSEQPRVLRLVAREIRRAGTFVPDPNWLRLWAHLEPEACADWLATRVEQQPDAVMPVLLRTAALLQQDLDERFGRTVAETSLISPRSLARWARLLLVLVRPEDDLEHHRVYSPGDRDHAQDLRYRCLDRLASNPADEARLLLLEMQTDPSLARVRPMIDRLLATQHEVAVEASLRRWTEDDILRVERQDEKRPRTLEELFELVKAHLRHVHGLVANDDFSYRDLFKPRGKDREKTKEREIQLWVAQSLRERARGLYSVVREPVVDDDKEVDISAFASGIGHVPIEIKPLGDYSADMLKKVLEEQLVGRYMNPPGRRCGILLLVRRDERTWKLNGESVDLQRLVLHLRDHARSFGARCGKDLYVAIIDLLAKPSEATSRLRKAVAPAETGAKKPHRPSKRGKGRKPGRGAR